MPISGSKAANPHLLVDRLGIPISISVTPADTHDTRVRSLSACRTEVFCAASLQKSGLIQQARGQELAAWCQATGEWELEVVECAPGTRGWSRVPRRSRRGTHIQLDFSQPEHEQGRRAKGLSPAKRLSRWR
jgi:hypothetical protein